MRIDPDTCRDPDLLVAEVRRLHAVIEAGSVEAPAAWHGVPVAWAAVAQNGQPLGLAYHRADAEGAVVGLADVVPLYRSPTLTDAEREAVETAMNAYGSDNANPECAAIEATLWGLLERTK